MGVRVCAASGMGTPNDIIRRPSRAPRGERKEVLRGVLGRGEK
jgi:hypothetical protein